jgi:hypothetical protein
LLFLGGCATIIPSQVGEPEMRSSVRAIPWLLAVTGLAIPLVGSGFVVWPLVALWLAILALTWSLGRAGLARGRALRVTLAIGLLPVLFVLAFEGGWWLIPADVAWFLIEFTDRSEAAGERVSHDAPV